MMIYENDDNMIVSFLSVVVTLILHPCRTIFVMCIMTLYTYILTCTHLITSVIDWYCINRIHRKYKMQVKLYQCNWKIFHFIW